MRRVFVFDGKGRCEGTRAYVLGETEASARSRLLRDDSCPYFDIKECVPFLFVPQSLGESK